MRIKSILFLLVLTLAATPSVFAQVKEPLLLTGTWVTTVTPPAEAGVPAFKLIFTFSADHNLIATGTAGEYPALGNPCQGTWKPAGAGEISITYVCLDFDASLQNTGMDKLRGRLTVDHQTGTLSGRIALTNYDPAGHEVFSACCAAVDGARLEVETLADDE